jgi:FkbM family methyltransferase
MNHKYAFAARHGVGSILGWLRLYPKSPAFACDLLKRRWRYFSKRQFDPFATPDGFIFPTPDSLVSYWSMFVERELDRGDWISTLQKAQQPLVVDVGANAGSFSYLVHRFNPRAEIIAFEPLPTMQRHLQILKQKNGMNFRCIPKAAGRVPGTATIESPHGYDGTSRILTTGHPTGDTLQVEVTTVDQELSGRPVLVMKIDVEGFEDEVIAGAQETLTRTSFVIIEAHDVPRRDHLTHLLGPSWKRCKLGASDYLFSRA